MRKVLLATGLCVLAVSLSFAQITLKSSDATGAYTNSVRTTYRTYYDPMMFDLGAPSSTAQTWNFSAVSVGLQYTDTAATTYVPPAGQLYASQFPSASTAGVAVTSLGGGATSTRVVYYVIDGSGVSILGEADVQHSPPAPDSSTLYMYRPPAVFAPLPATLGTTHTSVDTVDAVISGYAVHIVTTRHYDANGFGTLTFPNGMTAQALRVRTDFTTEIYFGGVLFDRTREVDYDFVSQNLDHVFITDVDSNYVSGQTLIDNIKFEIKTGTSGVADGPRAGVPTEYNLGQNYPNPFNPSTTIKYELPKNSHVSLSVYDILGREVSVLVDERREAGVHEAKFDGSGLASGVYFYRIEAGSFAQTKKLLLLR